MQFEMSSWRENRWRDTWVIKIWVLRKALANNFALSDAEDNTSGPLNRGGITDLPLLRTLIAIRQKFWEPRFWEVIDSCFISICKFVIFKKSFAVITCLLCSEDSFCSYKKEKVISMNYGSSTTSWNPWRWVRLELILTIRDIYINSNLNPLAEFTSSSRNTEFKDILPWNISQMIVKTIPLSKRIVISYNMKRGILLLVWQKVDGNWENTMIRISQWRKHHCKTNTGIRRNK